MIFFQDCISGSIQWNKADPVRQHTQMCTFGLNGTEPLASSSSSAFTLIFHLKLTAVKK